MSVNQNDTITITPHESGSSAPLTHADTYASRLNDVMADAESYFLEGMSLLGGDENGTPAETRAPATQSGQEPPPTTQTAPTNAGREAQGPASAQSGERPAAADTSSSQPAAGATPSTEPPSDASADRSRRRGESQQAILARENTELKARLAAQEEQNRQLLFDNKVLFGQHETVRDTARKQGAIRYEDVDQALTDAAAQQHQIRQAEAERQQQAVNAIQSQTAAWQAAIGERTAFGNTVRSGAINAILAAAIETKQEITIAQAEQMVQEGYHDPAVLADIHLWQSDRVPTDLANERIRFAYQRIAEIGKQKLVQRAVEALKAEQGDVPVYNRQQAYGVGDAAPPAQSGRNLTYQQRVQADLAAADNMFEDDLRRLAG
jgi:hypothetical protein